MTKLLIATKYSCLLMILLLFINTNSMEKKQADLQELQEHTPNLIQASPEFASNASIDNQEVDQARESEGYAFETNLSHLADIDELWGIGLDVCNSREMSHANA